MESIMFRIMNLKELHLLQDEIESIEDLAEREERVRLLEKVMECITDYDVHVREYAFKQNVKELLERGIVLEQVDREEIVRNWDTMFGSLVSEGLKSLNGYNDQFRWHVFSYELLNAIKGDEAKNRFDEIDKNELYIFFDYADEAYVVKNAHLITSKDIERLEENCPLDYKDIYFFDPKSKWTYIIPHEVYIGPYFCDIQ